MTEKKRYSKPPIIEALIDFKFEEKKEDKSFLENLKKIHSVIKKNYSGISESYDNLCNFSLGEEATASIKTDIIGYCFHDIERNFVFQVRKDGFTLSRLEGYECWNNLESEARKLYKIYHEHVKLIGLKRLAVRYINRVDISMPMTRMEDYFLTIPKIPEGIPKKISGFFIQMSIPLEDINAMVHINQTIMNPIKPNTVSVLLDIDIFKSHPYKISEEAIWVDIQNLRNKKNIIFEGCITDKTREIFQ